MTMREPFAQSALPRALRNGRAPSKLGEVPLMVTLVGVRVGEQLEQLGTEARRVGKVVGANHREWAGHVLEHLPSTAITKGVGCSICEVDPQ